MEKFKKELEHLINANSIDALCNRPDYELAEMVCEFLLEKAKEKEEILIE